MNEFEFWTVMKVFGIDDKITQNGDGWENIYLYRGLIIYFSNSSYAVIKGDIPLDFATYLSDKYVEARNNLGIRLNSEPREDGFVCQNGEYSMASYCVIDKKEGLAVFLAEYKDYLNRMSRLPETEVSNLKMRKAEIVKMFLYFIEPDKIKIDSWMDEYGKNNVVYFYSQFKNTIRGIILNRLLGDFHSAVNPFENANSEMGEIEDYIDEVDVSAYYSHIRGRSGGSSLKLIDRKTKSYLSRDLYRGGFHYAVSQNLGERSFFNLSHFLIPGREVIDIVVKEKNSGIIKRTIFNIGEGVIEGEVDHTPTIAEFNELCDLITRATAYATAISVDKMSKKGIQMKMEKKDG